LGYLVDFRLELHALLYWIGLCAYLLHGGFENERNHPNINKLVIFYYIY
jgi:hypothetical protein